MMLNLLDWLFRRHSKMIRLEQDKEHQKVQDSLPETLSLPIMIYCDIKHTDPQTETGNFNRSLILSKSDFTDNITISSPDGDGSNALRIQINGTGGSAVNYAYETPATYEVWYPTLFYLDSSNVIILHGTTVEGNTTNTATGFDLIDTWGFGGRPNSTTTQDTDMEFENYALWNGVPTMSTTDLQEINGYLANGGEIRKIFPHLLIVEIQGNYSKYNSMGGSPTTFGAPSFLSPVNPRLGLR